MSRSKRSIELFAQSGLQFSELYDLITILSNKGYFIKEGDEYKLNDKLMMFSKLEELTSYEKSDFIRVEFDEKLEIKYDITKIKEFLSKFVQIKNIKECFLTYYDIEQPKNES